MARVKTKIQNREVWVEVTGPLDPVSLFISLMNSGPPDVIDTLEAFGVQLEGYESEDATDPVVIWPPVMMVKDVPEETFVGVKTLEAFEREGLKGEAGWREVRACSAGHARRLVAKEREAKRP